MGIKIKLASMSKDISNFIVLQKNLLFIPNSMRYNLLEIVTKSILDSIAWFTKSLIIFENNISMFNIYDEKKYKYLEKTLEILKIADIGIQDVCLHKEYLASNDDIKNRKTINLPLELNLKIEVDKLEIGKIDIKTDFNVYNKEKEVIEKRKYIY